MKKLFSVLALMVSASFLPACAVDAGGEDSQADEIAADGPAIAPAGWTSCPTRATCANADRQCQDPEAPNQQYACETLQYCMTHCGYGVD